MLSIILFILGAVLGSVVNAAADALGWVKRKRSPWRRLPSNILEYIPVFGWFFSKKTDAGVSVPYRCLFVELFAAFGTVVLWNWEVTEQSLVPTGLQPELFPVLALRFTAHLVFFAFLLVASLTDMDDMIISDVLTIAGTLLGLMFAAVLPQTLLPATEQTYTLVSATEIRCIVHPVAVPLNVFSPNRAEPLHSFLTDWTLLSVLWFFWCFAMLPRVWYFQLPFRKASAIFCRYLRRSPTVPFLAVAAVAFPAAFWFLLQTSFAGSANHLALLSSLTGVVSGMLLIWGVRIIGSTVLGREAMGFGDVTLMGMVGAFAGWQSCIIIFFLAPFAGLLLGIVNAVLGKGKEIPYGPFLCLATVVLVVAWHWIWDLAAPVYELGWFVAVGMGVCLVLLGVLLGLWRWIRRLLSENPL